MRARLAAIGLSAALLAGCGGSDPHVATDPTGTPGHTTAPHWPTSGCESHSVSEIDYVSDAVGARTPRAAVAAHNPDHLEVFRAKSRPHGPGRWLLVNADHEIVREVTLFRGTGGWLVEGVEECAG